MEYLQVILPERYFPLKYHICEVVVMTMLITDLDNTLYDWITFFSEAFEAMVDELVSLLEIDKEIILDEFKEIHQRYGNTEQPFAILELSSVKAHFGDLPRSQLKAHLDKPLYAFNSARKRSLKLYHTVEETLAELVNQGVIIVGHTEAIKENSYYRLKRLGIDKYFSTLYSLDGDYLGHPDLGRNEELRAPKGFVQQVPKEERKPNPALLIDICSRQKKLPKETFYVGDSLTRDIMMANHAGVSSIWAKYGTEYEKDRWKILAKVSHWTPADILREEKLRKDCENVVPNYTIEKFGEILEIMNLKK